MNMTTLQIADTVQSAGMIGPTQLIILLASLLVILFFTSRALFKRKKKE